MHLDRFHPLRRLVIIGLIACLHVTAHAVECRLLGWDGQLPEVIVKSVRGEVKINPGPDDFSPAWQTSPGVPVSFYVATPVSPINPEGRKLIASAALPAQASHVLLILGADSSGTEKRYRAFALPYPPDAPGERSVRIFNFSRHEIHYSFRKQAPLTLAPLGIVSTPNAVNEPWVPTRLAIRAADRWTVVYSEYLPTPEDQTVRIFVRDNPNDPANPDPSPVQVRRIYGPREKEETVVASKR